ncbi:hypothetical protein [Youngiibacter multivorans]|uniref:Uncharacterized protein n=1 Tax=Youngiibacter multivorans TaxID=937251 RepID=A0ABS4G8N6_9CLOT|nr:hypothetical protein [Youngiibacter multivorans]MBP1920894.1 hypothetical protein [Youngiibacter multivorans]
MDINEERTNLLPGTHGYPCSSDPEESETSSDTLVSNYRNALKAAFDVLQSREKDILSYYISKGTVGLKSYSELWKEDYEAIEKEKDRVLGKMILLMESSYLDSI